MKRINYIIIGLISLGLLALELVWTRIFSAEFFYTYAFLILSLSVLGLGLGALAVNLFSFLRKDISISISLAIAAIFSIIAPILAFQIELDFTGAFQDWGQIFKVFLVVLLLSSTYFFAGISLAALFKQYPERMPKMYMFDMIGSGFGLIIAVVCMNSFGTNNLVPLCSVPIIISALLISRKWLKVLPLLIFGFMIFISIQNENYYETKVKERAKVIYKHWDAVAKIKVYEYSKDYWGLNIDNVANSPALKFDGNWNRPDSLKYGFSIDVKNLINRFPNCRFLSLGAGAGSDVLQALQEGAKEIYAVEVVPHINYMMEDGFLNGFTGKIYNDKRVNVVSEDARVFVRQNKKKFDVIYSLSSNTWAANASGAFALAENYLFTVEAFKDYWNSLSDNGFMMMEHQFYMPRIVSAVLEAFKKMDISNPTQHFAVYNLPYMRRNILLLSKQALTQEILENAFGQIPVNEHNYHYLLFPASDSVKDNTINKIVQSGWEKVNSLSKINVAPCFDDSPFVAQMGKWSNLSIEAPKSAVLYEFMGFPLAKLIVLIILAVVLVIVVPINLIPFLKKTKEMKFSSWLYFILTGTAFMAIEVVLIQKYALFIGSTVYSLVTVLLTILIFSGLGSRFSEKVDSKIVFLGIAIWLILDIFLFKNIPYRITGADLGVRMLISVILLAPLSFLMGMPFPKGVEKVGEFVDWGFAVSASASILGSAIALLVAMTYGFSYSLILAAVLYLLAFILFKKMSF